MTQSSLITNILNQTYNMTTEAETKLHVKRLKQLKQLYMCIILINQLI